jgi:hypothetical protein
VLLGAYLAEFTAADNVELYILTKPFMDGGNFKERMRGWANTTFHGCVDWSAGRARSRAMEGSLAWPLPRRPHKA